MLTVSSRRVYQETIMKLLTITMIIFTLCNLASAEQSQTLSLDGQSFEGKIHARGIYSLFGLIKVRGTLSFENDSLLWSVDGSDDRIPFQSSIENDMLSFSAEAFIENDEKIEWLGTFDGERVRNVEVTWIRQEGDFVHDLLLPETVILQFEQNRKQ